MVSLSLFKYIFIYIKTKNAAFYAIHYANDSKILGVMNVIQYKQDNSIYQNS